MKLETLRPNPVWDADSYPEAVAVWAALADEITVKVWGGDWCKDCRKQLPDFGAGLEAAGIDPETVEQYPVEKREDGSKEGEKVEEYGIEFIPTIVVERDGEELTRFVENAPMPAYIYLANDLAEYVEETPEN